MQKIGYLIIILVIGFLIYLKFPRKAAKTINQRINGQNITLEIADNIYLQAKGLSGRTQLCSHCGMLFIFNNESIQSFWMKDTLISLDMIFINKSGQITDIYTAAPEPGKGDLELTIYQSSLPAKYVIELNAGISAKLGLKKGDHLDLNL